MPFDWWVADFGKVLQHYTKHNATFRGLLASTHERRPCTFDRPWHIILNFDEATPGRILNLDNRRKIWTFFISVEEFGAAYLSREAAWIPVAVIRSDKVKLTEGKFSAVSRKYLRELYLEENNVRDDGVFIDSLDGGTILFFEHGRTSQDEDALNGFWSSKGASGIMPCWCCANVAQRQVDPHSCLIANDVSGRLVPVSCCDPTRFVRLSDDARFVQADALAVLKPQLGVGDFKEVEQAYGLTYNPHGVLWDEELRSIVKPSKTMYDPTHTLLAHGVVELEMQSLLPKLEELNVTFALLRNFVAADWNYWNNTYARSIAKDLLSPKREKRWAKDGKLSFGCSEAFILVSLMLNLLERTDGLKDAIPLEYTSFEALALVVDLYKRSKLAPRPSWQLRDAIIDHAQKYVAAYGDDACIPKCHYQFHLHEQQELINGAIDDSLLVDTLVTERKQSAAKTAAEPIRNTVVFEKSVIVTMINNQLGFLDLLGEDGMVDRLAEFEIPASWHYRLNGTIIREGQMVMSGGFPHLIRMFVEEKNRVFAVCHRGILARRISRRAAEWRFDETKFVELHMDPHLAFLADAWTAQADGTTLVLAPYLP